MLDSYECRSHSLVGSHERIRLDKTVTELALEGRPIENDARYQGDLLVQQKRRSWPGVHGFTLSIIEVFEGYTFCIVT
jgi:hypothetical protein